MTIDEAAKTLLEYMRLDMPLEKCDVIVGLGALDQRVAKRAAELFLQGYGKLLILTGGYGKITKDKNEKTEAEISKEVALSLGVDENKIFLETEATNTGENVVFTEKLLNTHNIDVNSLLIVTKPYMERRALATFEKQFQKANMKFVMTSPGLSYEDHFNEQIPKELFLNIIVGDFQRVKIFAEKGYQTSQEIPEEVQNAFNVLVKAGYTRELVSHN